MHEKYPSILEANPDSFCTKEALNQKMSEASKQISEHFNISS